MSLLTITGLHHSYPDSHILCGVDLVVEQGSCTCVMGRPGMGKTTLLHCIMGLVRAASGEMTFDGADLRGLPPEARARLGIGYVPQHRDIVLDRTVEENLRLALDVEPSAPQAIPVLIYELFPVLERTKRRRGGELTGDEQQQLAIARALVLEPQLLILDDAMHGLRPDTVHAIGTILRELNATLGVTMLMVERNLPFARRVASDFRILENGQIVANGPIEGLTGDIVADHLSI